MEIKILKNDLLRALKNACLIAPKKATDPIIQTVKLSIHEDKLTVSATDYDQIFNESMKVDIIVPGSCLVNAHKLFAIVKKIKSNEIHFTLTIAGWLIIQAGKLKTKIPAFDAELFPSCQLEDSKPIFSITSKIFKDIFNKTFIFIGSNEARRNLMGLNIKSDNSKVRFMGADARRIAEYVLDCKPDTEFNMIFPKNELSKASKIFTHGDLDFYASEDRVQIKSDTMEYQSRLIESEYPNLERLLTLNPNQCQIESESILDAIEMMEIVTNKEPDAVAKMGINSTLSFETQKLEFGGGQTEIDCEFTGSDFITGINVKSFSEIVKVFKNISSMNINILDPTESPIQFTSDKIKNYKAVLMPVRITW